MDYELWGTFSVKDHLRPRAFVADVLLYDRLVIPTPPDSDNEEQARWREKKWDPERQRQILQLMNEDRQNRVIRVPWTEPLRNAWESEHRNAVDDQQTGAKRAIARSEMAAAAAYDVSDVLKAREPLKPNANPEDFDALAFGTTRGVLRDWADRKNDTKLFMGIPPKIVDSVAAYSSYQEFSEDYDVDPITEPVPSGNLLNLFGWQFLVPDNPDRSDEDLLKEAIELANLDETKRHRQIFHRWRRDVIDAGKPSDEVLAEMEEAIQDYRDAIRRRNEMTRYEYAFAAVIAATGAATTVLPLMAIPAALAGLGVFMAQKGLQEEIPEKVRVAAMFHDARKRFGWRN
jgi:hypothetical protein